MVQARLAGEALRRSHPGLALQTRIIKTTGDERLDLSLSSPGVLDAGLFTKELEEALLRGKIHAAVHSLKDLPVEQPEGLCLGAILERGNPAEVLVSKQPGGLAGLPAGSAVGTCSPRRKNQLLLLRPDLRTVDLRGNVPTRLQKLAEGREMSAILLAKAGLDRLGDILPGGLYAAVIEDILPAPGQGAIALECRADDAETREILAPLNHADTASCVAAERALLKSLGGGCHLPLGVRSWVEGGQVRMKAAVFNGGPAQWLRND